MPDLSHRSHPSQFETALVNIVANARDAMDGEGSLTIGIDDGISAGSVTPRPRDISSPYRLPTRGWASQ
jgi:hypothetical protein